MRLSWFCVFASLLLSLSSLGKCTSCPRSKDVRELCSGNCPSENPSPSIVMPHEEPKFTVSKCGVNEFLVSLSTAESEEIGVVCIAYYCQSDSQNDTCGVQKYATEWSYEFDLNLPSSSGNVTCSFSGCYQVEFEYPSILVDGELHCEMWEDNLTPTGGSSVTTTQSNTIGLEHSAASIQSTSTWSSISVQKTYSSLTSTDKATEYDLTPTGGSSATTTQSNTIGLEHSAASIQSTSTWSSISVQKTYSSLVLETPTTTMMTSTEASTDKATEGSEIQRDKMLILYIISATLLVMVVTVVAVTGLMCVYLAKRKHTSKVKEILIDTCNQKPMSFNTITRFPTFESVFEVLDATCTSSEQSTSSIPFSPPTNKTKKEDDEEEEEAPPASVSDDSHSSNTEEISTEILFPKHMRHSTSSSSRSSDSSSDSSGPTPPILSPCTIDTSDTCIAATNEPIVFRIPCTCSQTCSGFSTTSSGYVSCSDVITNSGQTCVPESALPFNAEDSESTCVS